MTKAQDKEAIEQAVRAALAARKPTFLALLPRWLKIVGLVVVLLVCLLPLTLIGGAPDSEPPPSTHEEAAHEAEPPLPPLPEPKEQPQAEAPAPAEGDEQAPPPPAPQASLDMSDIQKQAAAKNDQAALVGPLAPAPDPELTEQVGETFLPKIAVDGRKPWRVYARPFDEHDPRPRIALVMIDMGLSRVATDAALRRLPPSVTLAFDPQAVGVRDWLQRARNDGHETLVSLPMEPLDYPRSDPGPNTLLTSLPNGDNLSRFFIALKSGSGYVGVTSITASRFGTDASKLQPMMEEARARGLLVLDTRVGTHTLLKDMADKMGVPFAVSARNVDSNPSPYAIDQSLADLERRALSEGKVVAIVSPLPSTLDRLEVWMKKLPAKGFALAPLSAVVQ